MIALAYDSHAIDSNDSAAIVRPGVVSREINGR